MANEDYDSKGRGTTTIPRNTLSPKKAKTYKVYGFIFGALFIISIISTIIWYPYALELEMDPSTAAAIINNPNYFSVRLNNVKVNVLIGEDYDAYIGDIVGGQVISSRSFIKASFEKKINANADATDSTDNKPEEIKKVIQSECKDKLEGGEESKMEYKFKYTVDSVMWFGYLPSKMITTESKTFDCSNEDGDALIELLFPSDKPKSKRTEGIKGKDEV